MKRLPISYTKQNHSIIKEKLKKFFDEEMTEQESLDLFQDLVDTGLAWQLGEDIADLASAMLKTKAINSPPSGFMGYKTKGLYQVMTQKRYLF